MKGGVKLHHYRPVLLPCKACREPAEGQLCRACKAAQRVVGPERFWEIERQIKQANSTEETQ